MKRIFLATSFSGKVDYETGQVMSEFRQEIESIIKALKQNGNTEVFCAIEQEGWMMAQDVPAEVGVKTDLEEIDKADTVIALVEDAVSGGVQFEIGYAVGKGKQVIVATVENTNLAYFNEGAANLGIVRHVKYASPMRLAELIL